MALVSVVNMAVLDNPAPFLSPFSFEITFECLQPLPDDLEWKVLYVGSAEDTARDQVLDEILVGPVPVGINKFVLQADAPDPGRIPESDVLGVTVVLVTCSYREKEFVRVGYYVNNEYAEPYDEEVGPPSPLDLDKVRRAVLSEKPRVTRFPIQWGDEKEEEEPKKGANAGEGENEGAPQDSSTSMEAQRSGGDGDAATDEMEEGDADGGEEEEDEDDDLSVEGKGMLMETEDVAMGDAVPASVTE
ncbi:hypothetical protein ACHAWF_006751 [Thalassiosira exigua]